MLNLIVSCLASVTVCVFGICGWDWKAQMSTIRWQRRSVLGRQDQGRGMGQGRA